MTHSSEQPTISLNLRFLHMLPLELLYQSILQCFSLIDMTSWQIKSSIFNQT